MAPVLTAVLFELSLLEVVAREADSEVEVAEVEVATVGVQALRLVGALGVQEAAEVVEDTVVVVIPSAIAPDVEVTAEEEVEILVEDVMEGVAGIMIDATDPGHLLARGNQQGQMTYIWEGN